MAFAKFSGLKIAVINILIMAISQYQYFNNGLALFLKVQQLALAGQYEPV